MNRYIFLLSFVFISACESMNTMPDSKQAGSPPAGIWYQPSLSTDWQIQLTGTINTNYAVGIYDIDLFDSSPDLIASIQATGRKVICYFSAGSYENWRPDASQFASSDLGNNLSGWPGEKWLDIRSPAVQTIMEARMDLAVAKGCDGVDPDNVDGYSNNSGFSMTAADQLAYNRMLASAAHSRGLSVGLKNDLAQVAALAVDFDFAVNEQCFQYNECDMLAPFVDAGKPVFNIEYRSIYVTSASSRQALCTDSLNRQFKTLILPLDLNDKFRLSCSS
jgi:hypothetical protein